MCLGRINAAALAGLLAGVLAGPAEASDSSCPRPVSATCFKEQLFQIEPERYTGDFPLIRLELYTSTYAYNVESQGTFVPRKACNGFFCPEGKEEVNGFTLFGDFVSARLHYAPARGVSLYGGVFFAIPFGGEDTIDDTRPIFSLVYEPVSGVQFIAGTLQPRHLFFDAIFDDVLYFIRPVEQGLQLLVDTRYYQHDVFINWQQENTRITNERFNIGYVGKVRVGPLRANLQIHWDHLGGEIPFPDFRPIETRNNLAWAVGPELVVSPAAHVSWLPWWRSAGAAWTFMGTDDEPNRRTPEFSTKGHANELRGWVDLAGWRIEAARWKSDSFVTSVGDRFFGVNEMVELGLSTLLPLFRDISLEFGGLVRYIDAELDETPASVVYGAAHWNIEFDLGPLFKKGL